MFDVRLLLGVTAVYTEVQDIDRGNGDEYRQFCELVYKNVNIVLQLSVYFYRGDTDSPSWLPVSIPVISLVHPITSKLKVTMMLPIIKKGLRLPNRDVQRSDRTPTIGCINKPF